MNETAFWIIVAAAFPFVGVAFLTFVEWVINLILQIKVWHDFYEEHHQPIDPDDCPYFDIDEDGIVI